MNVIYCKKPTEFWVHTHTRRMNVHSIKQCSSHERRFNDGYASKPASTRSHVLADESRNLHGRKVQVLAKQSQLCFARYVCTTSMNPVVSVHQTHTHSVHKLTSQRVDPTSQISWYLTRTELCKHKCLALNSEVETPDQI